MNHVVVVTGASAGVGRATAIEFARRGADVALIARGRAGLEAAARDVEREGRRALVLPLDVADPEAVDDAAGRVEVELGPIDVWVNDAMLSVFSPIAEMEAAEYRRVTEVTYLGYVHGTLAALRRMRPRNRGVVVQVGSALAYRSIPLQSAYCAAKHAMVGFTDSLRCELIHERSGIRVTVVNLPAVNTPQFDWVRSRLPHRGQPVPPIFQPEVPARAIADAAEHPHRETQVGWSTYLAIWGQKFVPSVLDWYLGRTGYGSQQTNEPEEPDRPDNLAEPLDAAVDHGAHGRFDARASDRAPLREVTRGRAAVAAGTVGIAALAAAILRTTARSNGGAPR